MEDYITYPYNKEETTLKEFVENPDSIIQGWTMKDFLRFSINEISNFDNIFDSILDSFLSEEEKDEWCDVWVTFNPLGTEEYEYENLPIFPGTIIYILNTKINRLNAITDSKNQVIIDPSEGEPFIVKALKELIDNPLYQVKKTLYNQQKITQFSPRVKVWLWSRTLSLEANKAKIINLTPFIENLSINSSSGVGSWNFSLPPIPGKWEEGKGWVIDETLVSFSIKNNQLAYVGQTNIDTKKNTQQLFFFEKIIQKNDIIFISFEPLSLDETKHDELDYLINKSELANNVYDMIGVVTNNSISKIESNNNINLNINGGDLLTIFNDDTFYFYPEAYLLNGMFAKGVDKEGLLRIDNKLPGYITVPFKKLSTILQFIMNALSTIEIVPNNLFTSYADDRTTYFKLPGSLNDDERGFGAGSFVKGIWQIIKIVIDERVENRYLVDSSLGNTTSTALANIQRIIQEPFVQLLTDTYLNQYYLTIRQAPWDKEGYTKLAKIADDSFYINSEDVLSDNLSWNNDEVFSWYRLIPTGLAGGVGDSSTLAYLQAVRFPEYAKIWGEGALEITSNYIRMYVNEDSLKREILNNLYEQAVRDLKFLIDCYAYMPFTRKGSIVVKGDRKYKKGLIIYHELTDEYFYVDSVQQSFSAGMTNDRTTTLTVSRGMIKKYIDSYFNIIKTTLSEKDFKVSSNGSSEVGSPTWMQKVLGNWKVNKEIFDFFLKKKTI